MMTVDEAAKFLRMRPRHVRRLVAERRIVFYRIGRCVRFSRDDLTAYVNEHRVTPITASEVWHDMRKAG